MKKLWVLRRVFSSLSEHEAIEILLKHLKATKSNHEFLSSLNKSELMND